MTLTDKIQTWLDSSIVKLVREYDEQGRRASGQWEKDLEGTIDQVNTGFVVKIMGSYYSYWMENGRRPGKFPPMDAIRQWIQDKGIIANKISEKSLAFLIARKIAREGYNGKPVIANVLTDEWIGELLQSVGLFFTEQMKSDIINQLKAA
jgi:hypothetical protein